MPAATMSSQPKTTDSGTIRNTCYPKCSLKLCYHLVVSYAVYVLLAPIVAAMSVQCLLRPTYHDLTVIARSALTVANLPFTLSVLALAVAFVMVYLSTRRRAVYLLDFACYKPGPEQAVTHEEFMRLVTANGAFTDDSLAFQRKILERSGLGQETYIPRAAFNTPPKMCMAESRAESEALMFSTIDKVLAQTGVPARDIGIVIVNSGSFNPTPSLSSMIVNHYKLRADIDTYNLSGMGCSAGLISINLAKQLLQVHQNTFALVVSVDIISYEPYLGNNRYMLMSNCLFRLGSAAVLLTNRRADRRRAKYQLLHTVRTHRGADDRAYRSVFQQDDEAGHAGMALSKDLVAVAGDALKTNITTLGPLVLPMSEQILYLASLVARKVFGSKGRPYIPDFKMAFEHFCIHAGGRAVLDAVEKSLDLSAWHLEPSRMTLYRWGNTSSSSIWYELAYTEAQGQVRRGHRAWQIAFGSGFKCNSAVWRALRNIEPAAMEKTGGNPWVEEIHKFPVEVPNGAAA